MTAAVAPRFHLMTPKCAWCRCFPCACERERYCACGGRIVATDDVPGAVRAHQLTPRHAAWREANGL